MHLCNENVTFFALEADGFRKPGLMIFYLFICIIFLALYISCILSFSLAMKCRLCWFPSFGSREWLHNQPCETKRVYSNYNLEMFCSCCDKSFEVFQILGSVHYLIR
jgi:hypothetical protein